MVNPPPGTPVHADFNILERQVPAASRLFDFKVQQKMLISSTKKSQSTMIAIY